MSRAVSIHIGVNNPRGRMTGHPLKQSEEIAWRMAGLAEQAGYPSLLVLRGEAATRRAVHDALTAAAGTLARGDTLLVSFAGHGCPQPDDNGDDEQNTDETWCLHDGEMVDDQLAGYWRLFQPGVRIVVVVDACHSSGSCRDDEFVQTEYATRPPWVMRGGGAVYRSGFRSAGAAGYAGACIGAAPHESDGIHASVLLLASARDYQKAQEGLFTEWLLKRWDGGTFRGSFCDLHREVRERVMAERGSRQEPQIVMLGSPDPGFPLEPAFHLDRYGNGRSGNGRSVVYR